MLSDEAAPLSEPLRCKSQKRTKRSSSLVIYILLIVAATLGINNFIIYNWYNNTANQVKDAFLRMKTITMENDSLVTLNRSIKYEYSALKKGFDKILTDNEEVLRKLDEINKRNSELLKQNEELSKQNKELTEDNIELQNSLKMAASVGIKPQNFTDFKGITSRGTVERGEYVGKFLGTAYTPSKEECGNDLGITNSGKPIIPGISIAIDKKYWPFGTVFYIKGLGYAVAMDTGNAIKGKHRFDFAVFDREFAKKLGSGYWDVYLVRLGNGKVEDVKL